MAKKTFLDLLVLNLKWRHSGGEAQNHSGSVCQKWRYSQETVGRLRGHLQTKPPDLDFCLKVEIRHSFRSTKHGVKTCLKTKRNLVSFLWRKILVRQQECLKKKQVDVLKCPYLKLIETLWQHKQIDSLNWAILLKSQLKSPCSLEKPIKSSVKWMFPIIDLGSESHVLLLF